MSSPVTDTAKFLQTVPTFSDLSNVELEVLAKHFQPRSLKAQAKVIRQGEMSESFFVIQMGFVNIMRGPEGQEVFISTLGPGEYFGEAALFSDVKRTAHVVAFEDLTLLAIDREAFARYLAANPAAASKILFRMLKDLFLRLDQTSSELQFERKGALAQTALDKLLK